MSKIYVYSTLAAAVLYTNYAKGGGDLPVEEGAPVLIHGGTGVADKRLLETPLGVVTEITAEQLVYLEQNAVFQQHKRNGFISIDEAKKDPERVVSEGMQPGDDSRQLTPDDFAVDGGPVPQVEAGAKKSKK